MKRKLLSMLCAAAMVTALAVPATVMAGENSSWDKVALKEEWTYTDEFGTNLHVRYEDNTLYVEGNGAIPAYTRDALGNRPWHNKNVFYMEIGEGVTSIGAEAFSNLKNLRKVTMSVNTFIEDPSAFAGAWKDCIFDFEGMNIVSRDYANVPYDSVDSIALFMEKYSGAYRYEMDNYYMTTLVQSRVNPKVENLTPEDALSKEYNPNYPIVDYSSTLSMVSAKPDYTMSTNISRHEQGKKALQAISDTLADPTFAEYEYGMVYNMSVNSVRGIYKRTNRELTYRMTIPEVLQKPGRQFMLLQLCDGVVDPLEDEDMNDNTLTYKTAKSTGAIALIYKD